jgi:thiosulfate/3-mercaptopyruvate sulfurtransferase
VAARYRTLISSEEIAAHLGEPGWVVVDCRFSLSDPEGGRRAYGEGHLPGARYAHLDQDLSGPRSATSGRHPLPAPEALAQTLASWGIGNNSQVVAYDERSGAFAARLWWLLRWLGHDAVAVLDGGLAAWRAHGLPLETATPAPAVAHFAASPRPELLAGADEILGALGSDRLNVVDARAPARFRGDEEPIDPIAGHIPGAVNHPTDRNLDADGRFLPPDALVARLRQTLAGAAPGQVVSSCGSGVTACHNLLAMEVAGMRGGRLYAGSWSEWIRDPARPVAKGG